MYVSIVIPSFNGLELLQTCLLSLFNQTFKDFEVIVVDNNSNDIDKLMNYKTSETNIIYIKNYHNLGFSGGNNVGIKKAIENGSEWMLLLNNDTWVDTDFISHLKADLEGKEGIVGIAINEGERTVYAGKIDWLKPTLIHITMFDVVSPQIINKNYNNDVRHRYYAIGGAMVIHKSVFDKIGFLDENYFLYFEDADFCLQAKKMGIPISFLPEIKICHSVSSSTKKLGSPMLLRYHYRNALYFNLKNGPVYLRFILWLWRLEIMMKQFIKIILGKNKEESWAILNGVFDYYKRNYGKIH